MTKSTQWYVRPAKTQISLIRVFAVRMKKSWILTYLLSAKEDSDQTGRMPSWSESSLGNGRTVILLVLSWGGSIILNLLIIYWKTLKRNSCFSEDQIFSKHWYWNRQVRPSGLQSIPKSKCLIWRLPWRRVTPNWNVTDSVISNFYN